MNRRRPVYRLTLVAVFTALLIAGAFFKIPIPPVPLTLQAQIALMGGTLLGAGNGALAAALYVLLGLLGLPVFAGGGGLGYVLQPTFGYLLGFVGGAFLCGCLTRRGASLKRMLAAQLAGLAVIYALGIFWYGFSISVLNGQYLSVQHLLTATVLTTLPADILLTSVASIAAARLRQYLK